MNIETTVIKILSYLELRSLITKDLLTLFLGLQRTHCTFISSNKNKREWDELERYNKLEIVLLLSFHSIVERCPKCRMMADKAKSYGFEL